MVQLLTKLNTKKVSKPDNIPTKVIKEFGIFLAEFSSKTFYSCFEIGSFYEDLKYAEVVTIYKKNDKNGTEQLDAYFGDLLSKYQGGFRQGYGTQLSLGYDRKTQKN